MNLLKVITLAVLCAWLAGCSDGNLHLKVHYRDVKGLEPGAAVLHKQQPIGSVVAVEPDPQGGYLVSIAVADKFAASATTDSRFFLADRDGAPGVKQIEVEQSKPDGAVLAEGSTVEGSERITPLFPFGEVFRQFSEGLRGMREQVEQLQKDLKKLPHSEEGKRLQQEWRRLTEEIEKAQGQAEESVRKDLLPKLEAEMERLRERFQRMDPKKSGASSARPM
jgi:paraquat-inducible protein B